MSSFGHLEGPKIYAPHRAAQAVDDQTRIMRGLMSGQATWDAMKSAVEHLRRSAPKDHDVFVMVADVAIIEAFFMEPHTFLFEGVNQDGHHTWIVLHFSQLAVGVVHRPKRKPEPVCTGFCPHAPPA
jgi:hypothetical protein